MLKKFPHLQEKLSFELAEVLKKKTLKFAYLDDKHQVCNLSGRPSLYYLDVKTLRIEDDLICNTRVTDRGRKEVYTDDQT